MFEVGDKVKVVSASSTIKAKYLDKIYTIGEIRGNKYEFKEFVPNRYTHHLGLYICQVQWFREEIRAVTIDDLYEDVNNRISKMTRENSVEIDRLENKIDDSIDEKTTWLSRVQFIILIIFLVSVHVAIFHYIP